MLLAGDVFRGAVGGGRDVLRLPSEHALSDVGGRRLPPCQIAIGRRDIHSVSLILYVKTFCQRPSLTWQRQGRQGGEPSTTTTWSEAQEKATDSCLASH
jgi:hypothetical protein